VRFVGQFSARWTNLIRRRFEDIPLMQASKRRKPPKIKSKLLVIADDGDRHRLPSVSDVGALIRREAYQPIESACSPVRSSSQHPNRPVKFSFCPPELAGKYWQNYKRAVLARILAAAVSVTVIFGAQAAGAQTPPLPQASAQLLPLPKPTPQQLGAPSVPAGYSTQSTLTGPIFLGVLNTIVKHGDLTDIAFLEKTLGTKINMDPIFGPGTPGSNGFAGSGYPTLGNSIAVGVIISGKDIQAQGGRFAEVDFRSSSLAISRLRLTSADFVSLFGQLSGMWTGGYDLGEGSIKVKTEGTKGTKLEVSFGWICYCTGRSTLQTERITDVTITEFP